MQVMIGFAENSEEGRYLRECARQRDISVTALVRRMIAVIAKDKLAESVLDDKPEEVEPKPGEYRYRPPKPV